MKTVLHKSKEDTGTLVDIEMLPRKGEGVTIWTHGEAPATKEYIVELISWEMRVYDSNIRKNIPHIHLRQIGTGGKK